ncbi:MAG: D-Ala-D-Ala carboxypeptidase family metallohydrolase [Hyphomicrobiales bacterium]
MMYRATKHFGWKLAEFRELSLQRLGLVLAIVVLAFALLGCSTFSPRVPYPHAKVNYSDTKWCVPRRLKGALQDVAHQFGDVGVTSTKRWWLENLRKGGAKNSYHRRCKAADFNVRGDPRAVVHFLKNHPGVGGYKYYRGGHYHIDTGPKRTW